MTPQIITVYNIHDAIEDAGIQSYVNTLVQEMGGQYFYVAAERYNEKPDAKAAYIIKEIIVCCERDEHCPETCSGCDLDKRYWQYKVWPIPLRLAWFCIDALKLKSSAINLGNTEYDEPGKQAVYLTPGKILFGKKIEKITEIPANLMPVCVEKL